MKSLRHSLIALTLCIRGKFTNSIDPDERGILFGSMLFVKVKKIS